MIAVDTNILVYAHRADSSWHGAAERVIAELAEGPVAWGIPWPCIHEFLAICTHPRIYNPPTPMAHALEQVAERLESPTLVMLAEGPGYTELLLETIAHSHVVGAAVHDARIIALCRLHGIQEILSADRDLSRFPSVRARNPLRA